MIKSISIHNFKAWRSADLELSNVSGLFGTNSSGKSSLLHLLILLKRTAGSSYKGQVLDFRPVQDGVDFGSFQEILYGHDTSNKLSFTIEYITHKPITLIDPSSNKPLPGVRSVSDITFDCTIHQTKDGSILIEKMAYTIGGHRFGMTRDQSRRHYKLIHEGNGFDFVRTRGRAWDLTSPTAFYKFSDQVTFRYQNADFLTELESSFQALMSSIFHLGPLRDVPERRYPWPGGEPADLGPKGEYWIHALLASRTRGAYISPGYRKRRLTLEERVASWLKRLGLISDFTVEQIGNDKTMYRVLVRRESKSPQVLLPDVGFGVSQVLPVLIALYYAPEKSVLLLEQPEIHLHPAVQSTLADAILDAVSNRNIQVIIESHSEHLLHRLQRRVADETIENDNLSLYFVQKDAASSAVAMSLDVDMYGVIRNWPEDFFGDPVEDLAAAAMHASERKTKS